MRDSQSILVGHITKLDFEIQILKKYREIVEYFLLKAEMITTLDFDLGLLKNKWHPAIVYRSERKKILRN